MLQVYNIVLGVVTWDSDVMLPFILSLDFTLNTEAESSGGRM